MLESDPSPDVNTSETQCLKRDTIASQANQQVSWKHFEMNYVSSSGTNELLSFTPNFVIYFNTMKKKIIFGVTNPINCFLMY